MIRLQLPLAPSVNRLWRSGSGGRVYRSKEYTSWLDEAGWMVRSQTRERIIGPYILHIAAVKPNKRKRDLDNILKATSDLLEEMGVVESDSECQALAAEWVDYGSPMTVTIFGTEEETGEWQNIRHLLN